VWKATWKLLIRTWPFLILAVLAVVFVLMLIFSRKAPVIASLDPAMAAPGQQVIILGDYFGRTEREGTLNLAGEIPPPSLIQSWTDQRIVFVVPEDASSGLVTVSNSQGTSTGVLFTNTESIPTVLQAAAAPGVPLLVAVVPSQPQAGQGVTLTGRGFGTGDRRASVRLSTGNHGPVFEFVPSDCQNWTDRSVSFRWPAGAGSASTVQVVTPFGQTPPFALEASSPLVFEDPRTLGLAISAKTLVPSGAPLVLWGPVPQGLSGTSWVLDSAQPTPLEGSRPLTFLWPGASSGERMALYHLTLTTWTRRWDGFPAGTLNSTVDTPKGDERPLAWWKPSVPALRVLSAKWGLETSDPWLRVQRIQNGLASAFRFETGTPGNAELGRTPAQILASGVLDSREASSLALVLAGQAGVPGRLVSGLWLNSDGVPVARVWAEVWFSGAGWVPWDVADGSPGALDNRHFAFETVPAAPGRLLPRARLIAVPAPMGQGEPAGEVVLTGQEPSVRWEIQRTEK